MGDLLHCPLPSPQLRQLSFYLTLTYIIINIDSSVFQEKTNLLLTLMALLLAGLQESLNQAKQFVHQL